MTELEELRKKIEEITIQMLSLLKTRTEIAQEIGKIKHQQANTYDNTKYTSNQTVNNSNNKHIKPDQKKFSKATK